MKKPDYKFSWREGNHFELLIDGDRIFSQMLRAIDSASASIKTEMYLFESGVIANRFIDAFLAAVKRGVHVYLLLDGFGARGLSHYDRQRMLAGGINLLFFNPIHYHRLSENLFRDHRKLTIVDDRLAFVGGIGFTDEFDPPDRNIKPWRDNAVQIQGPVVADWCALYGRVWNRIAGAPIEGGQVQVATAGDVLGRVTGENGLFAHEIRHSLIKRMLAAERRVWLQTAYFVPSHRLLRTLKRAAKSGTDVRLVLSGPHTDHPGVRLAGQRFYQHLLANGVRIFEYQPRVLHGKALLCDDWVSMGSSNFDRWNLKWNLEANQEIDNHEFAQRVVSMFELDMQDSVECRAEDWLQRSRWQRLNEVFWGKVDKLLNDLRR